MAARMVKLTDTGEIVEKTKPGIYYAPNRKYYSSEEAYLEIDLDNALRVKCIEKMYDFMGYADNQKLSTFFYKKLSEWRDGYKYSTILRSMNMSEEAVEYAARAKDFSNENAKVMYLSAIIQNKLNDALKTEEFEKSRKKKSENITEHYENITEISNVNSKKRSNVSHLVGEL